MHKGIKQLVVSLLAQKSPSKGLVSIANQSNLSKSQLWCASNQGIRSIIVRNDAFLLVTVATSIDSAYTMHNAYHCALCSCAQLSAKYSITGKDL